MRTAKATDQEFIRQSFVNDDSRKKVYTNAFNRIAPYDTCKKQMESKSRYIHGFFLERNRVALVLYENQSCSGAKIEIIQEN